MGISISMTISQGAQSIANNTTVVTATVKYTTSSSTYNNNKKPGTITLDGSKYSFTASFAKGKTNAFLASASKTVTHNSNGTRSVSASATFTSGVSSGTVSTGTKSLTLTTIPRASDVTCPATFNVNTAGTITLSRKNSGFTHTATNSLGNTGMSATSDIATSFTYTPPISLFNSSAYANVSSRDGTITIQTKSGTTNIGSAITKNIAVKLPENDTTKPTCTLSGSFEEYGSAYLARYGVLIDGKSKLKTSGTSAGKVSATVKSRYASIPGSSASVDANNNITTDYLTTSSSEAALSFYVKDSRGFTSKTVTAKNPYKVVKYKAPTIISLTSIRTNASGVEDPTGGTYLRFKVNYAVDPIAIDSAYAPNTATVRIYMLTKDGSGNVTGRTLVTDASGGSLVIPNGSYTNIIEGTYPIASSYEFEATIVDELTTTEAALGSGVSTSILTAKALMSFFESDGITFGQIAEAAGINIYMDTTFNDGIYIDDESLEGIYDDTIPGGGDGGNPPANTEVVYLTPAEYTDLMNMIDSLL